jgi:DNA modification methylase
MKVLPFQEARDEEDEKHVHPLQLDVIERILQLWSNPGEIVLTPFMGVGSEVFQAVRSGRKGIGIELKPSYFRQAVKNIERAEDEAEPDQVEMFEQDVDFLEELGIDAESAVDIGS